MPMKTGYKMKKATPKKKAIGIVGKKAAPKLKCGKSTMSY